VRLPDVIERNTRDGLACHHVGRDSLQGTSEKGKPGLPNTKLPDTVSPAQCPGRFPYAAGGAGALTGLAEGMIN
jgi:hypothetical protein